MSGAPADVIALPTTDGPRAARPAVVDEMVSDEELNQVEKLADLAHARLQARKTYPQYLGPNSEELEALALWKDRYSWFRQMQRAQVPRRLWWATFDPAIAQQTAVVRAARRFGEQELANPGGRRALAICGPTGVGKTIAILALLRARQERFFFFFHVPELVQFLLDPDEREGTMVDACDDRPLVLDDMGAGYAKEGGLAEGLLEQILWHREAENLITFITSNFTKVQLCEFLGDRIADRLQGPWGRIVECPGASLRGKR